MKLFVDSIFREDHNVMDLLTANYTYVNERLALLYGINNVQGRPVPPRAADRTRIASGCWARAPC